MWLIVGLGNPGKEYEHNRHNIGFMAVDALANDYYASSWKSKFSGLITEANINNIRTLLFKPQTYMNLSGSAVAQAAKFYKIAPENIIVLHDELDLVPFKVRIKKGGGHAGHNGLKSIDAHLGSKDYWRVRIGIGHPGQPEMVSHYVLSDFAKAQQTDLNNIIDDISRYFPLILEGKIEDFMTKCAAI